MIPMKKYYNKLNNMQIQTSKAVQFAKKYMSKFQIF